MINNRQILTDTVPALVILGLLGLLCSKFLPTGFGDIDLIQYWSAAHLYLTDRNPYDPVTLFSMQQSAISLPHVIRMWNPPFIFPFIAWLAFIPFKVAVVVWLLLSCCAYALSYFLLTGTSIVSRRPLLAGTSKTPEAVFLLTFYPVINTLSWGQLSCLLLLGLALFMYFMENSSLKGQVFAGLALSITLLKPHLLFLPYLFLLFYAARSGRLVVLISFVGFSILSAIVVSEAHPAIWNHYLAALGSPPIYFKTPTLGSLLQGGLNLHHPLIRFAPTVLGVATFMIVAIFKPRFIRDLRLLFCLIPLSLILSPYGWGYDQTLLLPTALWILRTSSEQTGSKVAFLLVLLNFVAFIIPAQQGQHYLIWYPLAILWLALHTYRQSGEAAPGR